MNTRPFRDREDAAHQLATHLSSYAKRDDVIVLALPRGGVPVAFPIAQKLEAPLDVLVVRKLGVPGWPELAMGAIASGGVCWLNKPIARRVQQRIIDMSIQAESTQLARREMLYRGESGRPDVKGKTVLLIDDGLATGSTMCAAVEAVRSGRAAKVTIAVPVTSRSARDFLEPLVDEFITLMTPTNFFSVSQWYEDFTQTTDNEVIHLLQLANPPALAA